MQSVLDKSKEGKGEDARENVASDLGVGPMPYGHHAHQIVIFGLPESVLHHVAVQTCLYDLVGLPAHEIGYDDVLSKSFNIFGNSVVILSEDKLPFFLAFLDGEFIEVFGKMEPRAGIGVMLIDNFLSGPVLLSALYFRSQIQYDLLQIQELPVECIPLFGGGSRVVGHNDRSLPAPVLAGCFPCNKPVVLPAFLCKLSVLDGVHQFELG